MTNYKTFGEMSKEEQLALFVAKQEGNVIQRRVTKKGDCDWIDTPANFSPFAEEWDHVAVNKNGRLYLHKGKPTLKERSGFWSAVNARELNRIHIPSTLLSPTITNLFDPSIPWQESLVVREVVE